MTEKNWGRLGEELLVLMTEGVVMVDPRGLIVAVNPALERLTGYSRQELLGQSCALIRSDDCFRAPGGEPRRHCRLFDEGAISACRGVLAAKDGSLRQVLKQGVVLRDEQHKVMGALETFLDITEMVAQERLISRLRRVLRQEDGFQGILGRSPAMLQLFSLIASAAPSEAPVLISGETGTGKELVAQAIHRLGPRRQGPYIRLNCKALPEALLLKELVGEGRPPGLASPSRPSHLEAAKGGDLFLDEVGHLPLSVQGRLLRILCEGVIEREDVDEPVPVEVRLIAATSENLPQLVKEGRFRQDLYYRLNVFPIQVPPLRERREDIPLLAEAFLERACLKNRKSIPRLTPKALEALVAYPWPGNVRELMNAMEYAVLVSGGGEISPDHLPVQVISPGEAWRRGTLRARAVSPAGDRERLVMALQQSGGRVSEAAKILGVSRVTLWKWLKHFKIRAKEERGAS
uniref:PAS domain S-box protein n=1 Tax=Desulfobacca acetoxidans TaxID=60893 RepID=A0A7C5EPA3_9BACT